MPFSRRYFDGWDYAEVAEVLRELGFLHLKAIPRHDLILGVFSAEGTVCDISIGDRTAFHRGDQFYYDVEITVYYHAFPQRSCIFFAGCGTLTGYRLYSRYPVLMQPKGGSSGAKG